MIPQTTMPINTYVKAVVKAKGDKKYGGELTVHWQMRTEADELTDNQTLAFCCEAPTEKGVVDLLRGFLSRERGAQQPPAPAAPAAATPTPGGVG